MRIGIDISQLAYPGTGVAVYTEQLIRHLFKIDQKNSYTLFGSSLRRRNYLITSYFNGIYHQSAIKKKIIPLPISLLAFFWNRLHLGNVEWFTGQIDLFHSSDWVEPPTNVKKVTTIHDLLVYKYQRYMHPAIVANQRQKLDWVKKESALVIVDSQSTKQDVMEILGIKEDRLRVIYLGVDERFMPQSATVREKILMKYGIGKDYLLTMGGEPRKNTSRVISAYEILPQRKKYQLVIIGRFGTSEISLIPQGSIFIESVDYKDLPALYSGAACFVYPSLYEGFGLPILEAMACGCPVVTSNRGSLKEVAGEAAVIVDPEDEESIAEGISKVLESSDEDYTRQTIQGFSWAKKFTWEKTARETLKVYSELVRSKYDAQV